MDCRVKPGNDQEGSWGGCYADVPVTCPAGSPLSQR